MAHPAQGRNFPPLLLLHGAWHGAWCWERALGDLAGRGLEAHAISLPGHGETPAPPGHWRSTILDYARAVRAALAQLPGRPILVGHSAGGYVAQLLATGVIGPAPDLAGLVLIGSSPMNIGAYFYDRGRRGLIKARIKGILRRDPDAVREAFFRPDIPPEELERHRLRLVSEPPFVPMSSMLLRPRPAACRTPVLVIAAERDAVFDVEAQRETALAYGAELIVVPGAAHNLMLDPAWPVAGAAIERFAATLG